MKKSTGNSKNAMKRKCKIGSRWTEVLFKNWIWRSSNWSSSIRGSLNIQRIIVVRTVISISLSLKFLMLVKNASWSTISKITACTFSLMKDSRNSNPCQSCHSFRATQTQIDTQLFACAEVNLTSMIIQIYRGSILSEICLEKYLHPQFGRTNCSSVQYSTIKESLISFALLSISNFGSMMTLLICLRT